MATAKSSGNRQQRRASSKPKVQAVPDKPTGPAVVIANLEREAAGNTEPFVIHLTDGSDIVAGDPEELDATLLFSDANPLEAFAAAMSDEDFAAFLSEGLKIWQVKEIFNQWREWYGLGDQGE